MEEGNPRYDAKLARGIALSHIREGDVFALAGNSFSGTIRLIAQGAAIHPTLFASEAEAVRIAATLTEQGVYVVAETKNVRTTMDGSCGHFVFELVTYLSGEYEAAHARQAASSPTLQAIEGLLAEELAMQARFDAVRALIDGGEGELPAC